MRTQLLTSARRMAPNLSRGIPFVYILRLSSGGLYVGCSTDCAARFREHQDGTASHITRIDPPTEPIWIEIHPDYVSARKREAQIKKWSRAKKEALVVGDWPLLKELARSRD